ncbi:MAG TPA: hypothetical protein VFL76_09815 [Edaphocola sp.]|nr:hypothetical protein [Edaphocola sp.]
MSQIITARFPSNIALVKYWGKHGNQLPCNASLSMTLSRAHTEVKLYYTEKKGKDAQLEYLFEGQPNEAFGQRVLRYAQRQPVFADLLYNFDLRFESKNSFPHSAGIASSASAFAAIAAILLKASPASDTDDFIRLASRLARLGSGSACRSFYGPFAQWGYLEGINGSSDEFAVPVTDIHDNFKQLRDTILIVEDEPKKVSSSVGHGLMKHHPFARSRFAQANDHCMKMISVLKNGDFEAFISITEREALSLHAMMMTSGNYYLLIKPDTVRIIEQVFQFREATGLPLCFTLDAGPNVHLLYPESVRDKVRPFLEHYLQQYGLKSVIDDQAGVGGEIY